MIAVPSGTRVYLAVGPTDMRKSINGLAALVETQMGRSAVSGHLFVFCNRARTIVKALYWDHNGFCLWQKRLEAERFRWPRIEEEVLEIEPRQLLWLLSGLEIEQRSSHRRLSVSFAA
ncbi:IS66 family insertion sequence element accessory protein TnpB [Deferrisoma camini]|uniref:IS66 family insertion sequence element accessory protein TnpB n=1 Tax=Deferrisoma camini TaxID=1035120 RepID=UPI00046D94AA|nr:IS66 family insertion sequence element accessory protein TnpB [Deferrisoma camini]